MRHAELVGLESGRDVRMAPRVDVGVDAERHRATVRRMALGERIETIELARRLDVDRGKVRARPRDSSSSARLADAGEDDLRSGRMPAAQRHLDFADRVGVGAGCRGRFSSRAIAERGVRLERVVDCVRVIAERLVDRAVGAQDGAGAVDVDTACRRARRSPTARRRRTTSRCRWPARLLMMIPASAWMI